MLKTTLKTVAAFALVLISTSSFAGNGYCDGRGSYNAVQQCYKWASETVESDLKRVMNTGINSPKISKANKKSLVDYVNNMLGRIDNQCRTWDCRYNSLQQLTLQARNFVHESSGK